VVALFSCKTGEVKNAPTEIATEKEARKDELTVKVEESTEPASVNNYSKLIAGKWESDDDQNSVLTITPEHFILTYKGSGLGDDSSSYTVSNKPCKESGTNPNAVYLNAEGYCYEIVEVGDEHLRMIYLERGNTLSYHKAK
jgi:hypothetical protein